MLHGAFDPAFLPIDDQSGQNPEYLASSDRASHLATLVVVGSWTLVATLLYMLA